jgi:copper(I)-binding protein
MKQLVNAGLAAGLFLMAGTVLAAESLSVKDAWIREAPANANALGAFGAIENHTANARVLVAAQSAAAQKVQLHKSLMENGIHKMVPVDAIEVPANGEVKLQPGGLHIMLINPVKPVKAGDKVEITLEFKDGTKMPVKFEVRRADGMNMDMSGHNMGAMDHGSMHH